jgi:DNA-binding NtrC family response regulator
MSHPVAVLAIADISLRQRLGRNLSALRWEVFEAAGGAEALAHLEGNASQAVILDQWLPDLDVEEFLREVKSSYPGIDLISMDGSVKSANAGNGRRGELMHAIRVSQEWDGAAYLSPIPHRAQPVDSCKVDSISTARNNRNLNSSMRGACAPSHSDSAASNRVEQTISDPGSARSAVTLAKSTESPGATFIVPAKPGTDPRATTRTAPDCAPLPEFLGTHPCILEVSRRVRLVAPRTTPVLVQGPSGTGKELVAKAIHRLSPRSHRPFVVLNCAAIPESLLEAELFGHTRGAFTGAVQGRVGRIESANGGTLFLDEIGEMPLALQSKLLRFLEAGEIQRVGDNDSLTVDVRVVAATHQPLAQRARQGTFREDVLYRLAVFLIKTPALCDHPHDIPLLADSFLRRLSESGPAKNFDSSALDRLATHKWPGNVRELAHVIERAYILAEARPMLVAEDIEFESFD